MTDRKQPDEQQKTPQTPEDQAEELGRAEDRATEAAPEADPPADLLEPEALSPREQELEAEIEDIRNRLLRALAETENLRRRSEREVEDTRKYAITGFARELLDVADNLSRALSSIPPDAREENELIRTLADGVSMVEKALLSSFEKHQIKKIEPEAGEKFDHNRHQAMFEVATDQQPPGTVAQVMAPGYLLADRLLRPAMVGVAKAPPATPERQSEEAEESGVDEREQVVEIRGGARAGGGA